MRRREELKTREAASSTSDSRKEINPALAGISATRGKKGYYKILYKKKVWKKWREKWNLPTVKILGKENNYSEVNTKQ
jgi:hypothetical protein